MAKKIFAVTGKGETYLHGGRGLPKKGGIAKGEKGVVSFWVQVWHHGTRGGFRNWRGGERGGDSRPKVKGEGVENVSSGGERGFLP